MTDKKGCRKGVGEDTSVEAGGVLLKRKMCEAYRGNCETSRNEDVSVLLESVRKQNIPGRRCSSLFIVYILIWVAFS